MSTADNDKGDEKSYEHASGTEREEVGTPYGHGKTTQLGDNGGVEVPWAWAQHRNQGDPRDATQDRARKDRDEGAPAAGMVPHGTSIPPGLCPVLLPDVVEGLHVLG